MSKPVIVKLSEYELEVCRAFSQKRILSPFYHTRNQSNLDKVKSDIFAGACAEIAVFNAMKSIGEDISPPDFKIYSAKDKSFDADLIWNGHNLHVKSYRMDSPFDPSWIFQKQDVIPEKDLLCLCGVEGNIVNIIKIISILEINERELWGKPVSPALRGNKKAIYLKDILGVDSSLIV